MRVGLNATCFDNRPSGANQRFAQVYGALIRSRPDIDFFVYEPVDVRVARWFADASNVVARPTPVPSIGRLARARAGLGFWRRTLRADKLDLFEAFHLPMVRAPDCPTVLTVHDLRPVLPDQPLARRLVARAVLNHGFANAARVIAVSDVIAREIAAFRPGTRVVTIHNGVDVDRFAPAPAPAAAPFMLSVGHLEARKNLPVLVDAVATLRDRGLDRPLMIVGRDTGDRARVEARIAEHGLESLVTLCGVVDDAVLRDLYRACRLLVFPSRYEGFGIPILEAMAADRPMAVSDIPAFREILRDDGVFFPPDDPARAADAIEQVWSDAATRERLLSYGRERVRDFAFPRLAAQVGDLYRAVLAETARSAC